MSLVDWLIVIVPSLAIVAITMHTRKYVTGVEDFLAAGRGAKRYLLSVADGMAAMGLITAVGAFEVFYNSGLAIGWWGQLGIPVGMMIALLGFIIYRYRQARVLTMAEFFERRYSRSLRVFMGLLAFIAGVVNYGIFPIVGARFFVHFAGFPLHWQLGPISVSSYALFSGLFLLIALVLVLRGGQLQILVTDCVQGLICGVLFLVVAITILCLFSQQQMFEAMSSRGEGLSLINPFDTHKVQDFNIAYALISLFSTVYTYMSWQGNQGYNASALNAHEARMGKIIAGWRTFSVSVMFTLIGIGALTFMQHPDFSAASDLTRQTLSAVGAMEGEQIAKQLTVPMAVQSYLPIGVTGCFLLIMLCLMVSTDTTYLHSWGSIFVQDVVLPFRKKPLPADAHMRLLRIAIVGVAVFAFFFGLFFPQTDFIYMFFNITGAIYLGGSGAVIIGGLYWSRGTTAGAWGAMVVGSGLSVAGIVAPIIWRRYSDTPFPLNGTWMMFIAMLAGIGTYVGLSFLTSKRPFDMDALLHRGKHAIADDVVVVQEAPSHIPRWQRLLLGVDENFTRGDKTLSGLLFGWSMLMFGAFCVVSLLNLIWPWSDRAWWRWWQVNAIYLPVLIGAVTTVWFTLFGVRDLRDLFKRLRERNADALRPVDIEPTEPVVEPMRDGTTAPLRPVTSVE